jgi:hypothetical protein
MGSSSKSVGITIFVLGVMLVLGAALADMIGYGSNPWKFGSTQIIGLFIGLVLVGVGAYFYFRPEAKPVAEASEPAQTAAPGAPGEIDDLTKIEGVGPKVQSILYDAGVKSYQALAEQTPAQLTSTVKAGGFNAPFDPESWPEQAALAAEEDWEGLKRLQDALSGGRKT